MSAPAFAWAFEKGHELGLTSSQLVLLLYMADQANCAGQFFTGQPRLAKYTRLTERTIRELIPQLAVLGLIRVTATPGKPTMYQIVRQPIGAEATSAPEPHSSRANGASPPEATSAPPRQPVPPHPGNSRQQPRKFASPTPEATSADPLGTQEEDPKRRASAPEAGKILSFPEKESTAPKPVEFGSYLEQLRKRAQPLVVGQEVVRGEPVPEDDNPPVDPGVALAVLDDLKRSLRMRAYPPRAAVMSPDEMATAACGMPHVRPAYLPDDVLAALRADARRSLARRAVVS
jgi:Helix-turn-helix domain